MPIKTICESCGQQRTAGGHRFCRACIGSMLNQPTPTPIRESSIEYPTRPKRKK
jgi:hypothetical protein